MIRIWVAGEPKPRGSTKAIPYRQGSRLGVKVMDSNNATLKPWMEAIRCEAARVAPHPMWSTEAVSLAMHFYFVRPKGASKNKRPHTTVRPDIDKLARSVLDALTGVFFKDDSQVCIIKAQKRYSGNSGVLIDIAKIDDRPSDVDMPQPFKTGWQQQYELKNPAL